jgi:hypothetical protein
MFYAADQRTAERVLAELRGARAGDAEVARATLQRIRVELACERADDRLRLQAWSAIRRLYDASKAAPEHDLKPLWQDAISRTEAWRESMA